MRTCSAHTIRLAAPRPSFILDRRAPYVCAEPGAVVRTLRRRSDLMWSLALSQPLALGLAWLPAPCTFTRVVRGCLRHTRALEWCVVTCAMHGHWSGTWLSAPCAVTAPDTPPVQEFARSVGAWSLGLACSTGCALTWSPLLCGRRWLADKTKPPELGAWFEVRSLV